MGGVEECQYYYEKCFKPACALNVFLKVIGVHKLHFENYCFKTDLSLSSLCLKSFIFCPKVRQTNSKFDVQNFDNLDSTCFQTFGCHDFWKCTSTTLSYSLHISIWPFITGFCTSVTYCLISVRLCLPKKLLIL